MKKPEIDMQSKRMMVETKTYSEMIDALVEAHGTLESLTYSGADKFVVEEELKKIEQALKKAGCGE